MKLSYFPGCTLKNKAKDLDLAARSCARALGVELEEIKSWQCCGGVFTTARDEVATKLSSVRALADAKEQGRALVTVCSACHNVIKQTNAAMATDKVFADKVNRYIGGDGYDGSTRVYHYLEMLRDVIGFDALAQRVVKPLSGKRVAAYYGCLLLRPGKVMRMDDVENPTIMEDMIAALGADPVYYAMRNECCGGYVRLESPSLAEAKSRAVMDCAADAGADVVVTACPLCLYNLRRCQSPVPVVYFTELLAQALGAGEASDEA